MKVTCYQCNTVTDIEVPFEVKQFACSICHSVYLSDEKGGFTFQNKCTYSKGYPGLKVGMKGILEDEEFTITGIVTKKAGHQFYWTEFILASASGNFRYLSEVNGHWILLREIEDKNVLKNDSKYANYKEVTYSLYENSVVDIVTLAGFFDDTMPQKPVKMTEYIAPPYIISKETIAGKETLYFGEHISRRKIKRTFKANDLPERIGVGVVQPFFCNVRQLALICCSCLLLMLLTYLYVYYDKTERIVFSDDIFFSQYSNKEYVSPSFTLEGGAAPLSISLYTEVNNSWANAQVALINEETSEEVYANRDVEYYHGNTEGESWSEGNTTNDFSICGVNAGKYHLSITVTKAPEDVNNSYMRVTAIWNNASLWNIIILVIVMLVIVFAAFYGEIYYEKKRWGDSMFSSYDDY